MLKGIHHLDLDERGIEETDQLFSTIVLDEPIKGSVEMLRPVPPISIDWKHLNISIVQVGALEMIWFKAHKLLKNPDSIKQKPLLDSQKNKWEIYQVSSSNIRKKGLLYDLMVNENYKIKCSCLMYKNKEIGICSHRVALAERIGILKQYLKTIREHESIMENNLTDISLSGVNRKAAGKKSAIPRLSSQNTSNMEADYHMLSKVAGASGVSSSKQTAVIHQRNPSKPSSSSFSFPTANQNLTSALLSSNTSNQSAVPRMQGFERRLPTFHVNPAPNPTNIINKIPPPPPPPPLEQRCNHLVGKCRPLHSIHSIMLPTSFSNQSCNKFVQPRYLTWQQFPRHTNHSPAGRAMLPKPFPPPTTDTYTVKKKPKSVKTCISGCGFGGLENDEFVISR